MIEGVEAINFLKNVAVAAAQTLVLKQSHVSSKGRAGRDVGLGIDNLKRGDVVIPDFDGFDPRIKAGAEDGWIIVVKT